MAHLSERPYYRPGKPVRCELCKADQHDRCVRPCICTHELSEGGKKMALTKHGSGDVLREPEDNVKVAKKNWTEEDAKALAKENEKDDDNE